MVAGTMVAGTHRGAAPGCAMDVACFAGRQCPRHCALPQPRTRSAGRRGVQQQSTHTQRRAGVVRAEADASAESPAPVPLGAGTQKTLPIFPLGLVAFPTGQCPLNIFEARYRVLMSTLLAGADGIDADLVNEEKPWAGSRLFGMCYSSREGMATVGTTLHITGHERLPDGRLFINTTGVEKFRVLKVLEERPVLVCQVEILEDSDDRGPGVRVAADETVQLFKDLIELNVRMNRISGPQASIDPKLEQMTPREVSYWLGLVFSQNPGLQQALLEEQSLLARIAQEKEILEGTVRFLRAKVSIAAAFTPDGEKPDSGDGDGGGEQRGSGSGRDKQGGSEQPPQGTGGPD